MLEHLPTALRVAPKGSMRGSRATTPQEHQALLDRVRRELTDGEAKGVPYATAFSCLQGAELMSDIVTTVLEARGVPDAQSIVAAMERAWVQVGMDIAPLAEAGVIRQAFAQPGGEGGRVSGRRRQAGTESWKAEVRKALSWLRDNQTLNFSERLKLALEVTEGSTDGAWDRRKLPGCSAVNRYLGELERGGALDRARNHFCYEGGSWNPRRGFPGRS